MTLLGMGGGFIADMRERRQPETSRMVQDEQVQERNRTKTKPGDQETVVDKMAGLYRNQLSWGRGSSPVPGLKNVQGEWRPVRFAVLIGTSAMSRVLTFMLSKLNHSITFSCSFLLSHSKIFRKKKLHQSVLKTFQTCLEGP